LRLAGQQHGFDIETARTRWWADHEWLDRTGRTEKRTTNPILGGTMALARNGSIEKILWAFSIYGLKSTSPSSARSDNVYVPSSRRRLQGLGAHAEQSLPEIMELRAIRFSSACSFHPSSPGRRRRPSLFQAYVGGAQVRPNSKRPGGTLSQWLRETLCFELV